MPTKLHCPAIKPPLAVMPALLLLAAQALACPLPARGDALRLINAARAQGAACSAGAVGGLRWSEQLEQAANAQAQWLAAQDTLRHTGPRGEALSERVRAVGYRFARVTENLAYGQADLAQAVKGWNASPPHCANLHDGGVTEMALACAPSAAGRPVWVMLQARPL